MKQTNFHRQEYTHTNKFNGPLSGTTQVSWYQKGKTSLDFTEARDSEWQWQWHQLGHMLQPGNHASTSPFKFFLQAGCPSCRPTNSIEALKATTVKNIRQNSAIWLHSWQDDQAASELTCVCGQVNILS